MHRSTFRPSIERLEARDMLDAYLAGLVGHYYQGEKLLPPAGGSGPIAPAVTHVDKNINFQWVNKSGQVVDSLPGKLRDLHHDFSVVWTGVIVPKETAVYTFRTYTDDGVKLFVGGVEEINDWNDHAPTYDTATTSVPLQAGSPTP